MTVEVHKPGHPAHGMSGEVIGRAHGKYTVSLHGESEKHEGSIVTFDAQDLRFIREVKLRDPRGRWMAFLIGMVAGAALMALSSAYFAPDDDWRSSTYESVYPTGATPTGCPTVTIRDNKDMLISDNTISCFTTDGSDDIPEGEGDPQ